MELEISAISEIVKICLIFHSTKAIVRLKGLISPINDEIYSVLGACDSNRIALRRKDLRNGQGNIITNHVIFSFNSRFSGLVNEAI